MIAHRQRERAPCPLYIEEERMVFGASRGVFFDFFVCFPSRKVSVAPTPSPRRHRPDHLALVCLFDPLTEHLLVPISCFDFADRDDPPVNSCPRFHPIGFRPGNDVFGGVFIVFFCYCSWILMDRVGFL
ncbi:hypothetical protein IHE45_07G111500 [Dioscorea alata]|uniref:Uncharacterized protein n=1 Tax=Dioscorea alata TaxID=55571 RepID=A0ACB7VTS6_DIOAL|nr:hypothetical protein IHE45_07G111500 [Dioscorea alata]